MYSIGIIGVGVLGKAIYETFKSIHTINLNCYDKYKTDYKINNIYVKDINSLSHCDIIFLCLPTEYDSIKKEYNKNEIENVCNELAIIHYKGILLLKSTVEPKTTYNLSKLYPCLNIIHNPEFLSAKTAHEDFKNQSHIVLGISHYKYSDNNYENSNDRSNSNYDINKDITISYIKTFFNTYFKNITISICSSDESESMKLFCNSFYATKIQFFTEIKILCDTMNIEYNNVIKLMLNNGWINPMHTEIPGHDGQLSFGGSCLPKDINALGSLCNNMNSPNEVVQAVINENHKMRHLL